MKNFILLLLIFFSFSTFAHESPIAFAEMEINKENKIELTLIIDRHDIMEYLQKGGFLITDFENHKNSESISVYLKRYLLNGFNVWENSTFLNFEFLDYEINDNGTVFFYFESSNQIENSKTLKVRFDLMMQDHEEQQNKLILIDKKEDQTFVFTTLNKEIQLYDEKK